MLRRQPLKFEDKSMVATTAARSFVPADLNVADVSQLEPLYRVLLNRPLTNGTEAQKWLADFSELTAVVDEFANRLYINKSCHTDDAEIVQRFMFYVENVEPKIKPLFFRLQKKLIESPALS